MSGFSTIRRSEAPSSRQTRLGASANSRTSERSPVGQTFGHARFGGALVFVHSTFADRVDDSVAEVLHSVALAHTALRRLQPLRANSGSGLRCLGS